ncbi:MAG: hypothetical protein GXO49_01125 [Chlorobi bacterium]|nr:hypothetical protein [Chlorobiota bacterium]
MSFPYTYRNSLVFTLKKKFLAIKTNYIKEILKKQLENNNKVNEIKDSDEKLYFIASSPILNFNFSVDVFFTKLSDEIKVTYETNLEKLTTIILVTIILVAFFSFVSIKYFLILSGVLAISLYLVFYLIIDNFIQRVINKSLEQIIESQDEAEKYSDEQMNWINDEKRCSACGNYLSDFDLYCKECGIKLKRNKYTIPLDLSKHKDKEVSYHFKKKK